MAALAAQLSGRPRRGGAHAGVGWTRCRASSPRHGESLELFPILFAARDGCVLLIACANLAGLCCWLARTRGGPRSRCASRAGRLPRADHPAAADGERCCSPSWEAASGPGRRRLRAAARSSTCFGYQLPDARLAARRARSPEHRWCSRSLTGSRVRARHPRRGRTRRRPGGRGEAAADRRVVGRGARRSRSAVVLLICAGPPAPEHCTRLQASGRRCRTRSRTSGSAPAARLHAREARRTYQRELLRRLAGGPGSRRAS